MLFIPANINPDPIFPVKTRMSPGLILVATLLEIFFFSPVTENPITGSASFPIIVWPPFRTHSLLSNILWAPNDTCLKSLEFISGLLRGNWSIIWADIAFDLTAYISLNEWLADILPSKKGSVIIALIISIVWNNDGCWGIEEASSDEKVKFLGKDFLRALKGTFAAQPLHCIWISSFRIKIEFFVILFKKYKIIFLSLEYKVIFSKLLNFLINLLSIYFFRWWLIFKQLDKLYLEAIAYPFAKPIKAK